MPTGGAPALNAPLIRLIQPSEVTTPSQSRTTVTAIGVPSARHRPTVAVGVVCSAQSAEVAQGPRAPVTVYGSPVTGSTVRVPTRSPLLVS